jgi:GNAT superfamily N-acetyltransferase
MNYIESLIADFMDAILTLIVGLIGTIVGVALTKLTENYFDKKKEAKLFIADLDDVLRWGWDGKKLLRHLIALDYETTDNLNESNEGTPEQWAPVFFNHPDCWKLLAVRDSELVGYWAFFALKPETFELLKQGQFSDSSLTIDHVVEMDKPGTFNIYIVIMCVKEHYRRRGFPLLLASLIDQLNGMSVSGRYINTVCVNAFSDEGRALARNFGLKHIRDYNEIGHIYYGTFADMKSSRLARGKLV